ncbi:redoxin domain-containing protein [Alteromonas oceanisediminis]|uniref:redoxin domain-containing protein n=1 Tax=Alteromonas oceanisediminis TaxID=2836180 RepID=UPI001BDA5619|nr:redoxin domain-containing protein [Alteromonas oceanisediminis]MBT0586548.1 redoxin domain-containing protein [Alteromonas oceanisediminis]
MKLFGQKWTVWVRDIAIGGVIIAAVLAWQSRDMLATDGSIAIPPTTLMSLDGEPTPLFREGQQTLVYFFAPWCQVCHLSIGNLEYVSSDSIHVVRVALEYADEQAVADFAAEHEINSPILLGDDSLRNMFNVTAFPTYYLVDTDRTILGGSKGYSTAAGLKLRAYLNAH